jgi:superfamily I DNA and/or RNA helicase
MAESGSSYYGMKKVSKAEQEIDSENIVNVGNDVNIIDADPEPQLVGGTAWTLAKSDFRESFDYLFIDEAGQVSLANTIAMGMCAKNLILLGDQMQLGQPIQGSHPGRSGESALEFLLDGKPTIAPEKGIFLGVTYRMHPDVCRFISDAIYDSRLRSAESTLERRLVLDGTAHPALLPTGIRYFPIAHDACSQRSEEEAAAVREIVGSLLGQRYRDGDGREHGFSLENILVVAPYNMQVNLLKRVLPKGSRVATVDKFQGQEAEVVIVSMATSSAEYLPRNLDFLFSKNRINVAVSRAKCLSVVLFSPQLLNLRCKSPGEMVLVNTFAYLRGEN